MKAKIRKSLHYKYIFYTISTLEHFIRNIRNCIDALFFKKMRYTVQYSIYTMSIWKLLWLCLFGTPIHPHTRTHTYTSSQSCRWSLYASIPWRKYNFILISLRHIDLAQPWLRARRYITPITAVRNNVGTYELPPPHLIRARSSYARTKQAVYAGAAVQL